MDKELSTFLRTQLIVAVIAIPMVLEGIFLDVVSIQLGGIIQGLIIGCLIFTDPFKSRKEATER